MFFSGWTTCERRPATDRVGCVLGAERNREIRVIYPVVPWPRPACKRLESLPSEGRRLDVGLGLSHWAAMPNPLLCDRTVDFLLYEVFDAEALCALPAFADHSRQTFDMYLQSMRKIAREVVWPSYRPMDAQPPQLVHGGVVMHQAAAAKEGLAKGKGPPEFYEGKLCAAQYWIAAELPRVGYLGALCRSGEDSYARMKSDWF